VSGGGVSAGLEILASLPEPDFLNIQPPAGGQDLSCLAGCPSLTMVTLRDCTKLSDLSTLMSASRLRSLYLEHAECLRDLGALIGLADLEKLIIEGAPLAHGLAAVAPVLNQLKELAVWSIPTLTSLDALADSTLDYLNLADCQVTDLEPLGALHSLTRVWLRQLPSLNIAPLASLPQLRELTQMNMNEPVDLSPLAQTDHRLRVELKNTLTVGEAGPLVKVRRR
jgi:internalin A